MRTIIRVVCWMLLATCGGVWADDWPCFMGPTHDGVSAETNLVTSWPENGLPLVWKMDVGASYSAPSVVNGAMFLFHRVRDEEVLECLDAVTGARRWKAAYLTDYVDRYGYNGGPRCTALVAGDRVFTFGAAGKLCCFNVKTGAVIWQRQLNEELNVPQNFFGVGSSPLLEGGRLIINAGGPNGAGVVALDCATGKTVWQATDEGASYASPMCATIGGQRFAFVFGRGGLLALDPVDGKVFWRFPFRSKLHESVNAASPVITGDCVFVSASYRTGGALLRCRKDGYDVVWRDEVMSNHWATSILRDGYLYGFNGRHEEGTTLRCVEVATGKLMWEQPKLTRCSMIYANGHFIILTEWGRLMLARLKPQGCEIICSAQVLNPERPSYIAPVLSDGFLYVRNERQLLCFDFRANRKKN
ncbi:MAG: PQQ-like beta-propeller repeat protein [Verrucomicrobia bacterium]|nr:PQQ-like beta-propeller repeat protein [Verrucomicrobiota bacterium]